MRSSLLLSLPPVPEKVQTSQSKLLVIVLNAFTPSHCAFLLLSISPYGILQNSTSISELVFSGSFKVDS